MGWGPVKSSKNTSYNQINDKNYLFHYIYQIGAIMSKFAMTQKFMYINNDHSQWLIFSFSTKQTLFWWDGDLLNHSRTQVTTKSVTNINNFTRHISNWENNIKIFHGSELYEYKKMIVGNHWFSQSRLNMLWFDGLGTC